jgi:hypothetical protein
MNGAGQCTPAGSSWPPFALRRFRAAPARRKWSACACAAPCKAAKPTGRSQKIREVLEKNSQALLVRLEQIVRAEADHARLALKAGAAAVFLAIPTAYEGYLTREQYKKFSEPFDRMMLDAARGAELNILHLHGGKVSVDLFCHWPPAPSITPPPPVFR